MTRVPRPLPHEDSLSMDLPFDLGASILHIACADSLFVCRCAYPQLFDTTIARAKILPADTGDPAAADEGKGGGGAEEPGC